MEPLKLKINREEAAIQRRVVDMLTLRGWYVKTTHGNSYQAGLPDIFACHSSFGSKWIEIKKPVKYRFTTAQLTVFTGFSKCNIGVWVLTHENQYGNLMGGANWHTFLFNSSGITIEKEVKIIPKTGPESIIQNESIARLKKDGWFCVETYGDQYQAGFPDLYACHPKYFGRWIEFKNPKRYKFTPAQLKTFPRFQAEGVGVWVITSPDDLHKIHESPNWRDYLK